MKDLLLSYRVGALMYCPANLENIADALISQKFTPPFSLALCLEDTIRDGQIAAAEQQLEASFDKLFQKKSEHSFYMPLIFIRVREPEQIKRLYTRLGNAASLVTGFIFPKFSPSNAKAYIQELLELNQKAERPVYMMPILENSDMIDLRTRYERLYQIKEQLDQVSDLVLNVRVGGNDLCHTFGFRRSCSESIHDIKPVYSILSDIMTVFGMDYVVSGPVWEYYSGDGWDTGLARELSQDRLNGFVGKTVIHPNQIRLVNQAYQVNQADYDDAVSIVNWDPNLSGMVAGSSQGDRMNEYKTHIRWAEKTLLLAAAYGIR